MSYVLVWSQQLTSILKLRFLIAALTPPQKVFLLMLLNLNTTYILCSSHFAATCWRAGLGFFCCRTQIQTLSSSSSSSMSSVEWLCFFDFSLLFLPLPFFSLLFSLLPLFFPSQRSGASQSCTNNLQTGEVSLQSERNISDKKDSHDIGNKNIFIWLYDDSWNKHYCF